MTGSRILPALLLCIAVVSAEYVRVPGLGLQHKDCVHEVPDGSMLVVTESALRLRDLASGIETELPACPPGSLAAPSAPKTDSVPDGWQAYTAYDPGNSSIRAAGATQPTFDSFLCNWNIPSPGKPLEQGAVNFFFPGLENSLHWNPASDGEIIQPVLQWGQSAAGGGPYWAIASWFVSATLGTAFSTLRQITNGATTVSGNMTKLGPGTWFIGSQAGSISSNLHVDHSILDQEWIAYVTLESYEIDGCDQFPTSIRCNNITLSVDGAPVTPSWSQHGPRVCTGIKILDPETVIIVIDNNSQ